MRIGDVKWWRAAIVAVTAAALYWVVLRGVIEFLHPKDGWLISAVHAIGTEQAGWWTYLNICIPVYDFLTHSVWGLLWPDLVVGVVVALLVEYRLLQRRDRAASTQSTVAA